MPLDLTNDKSTLVQVSDTTSERKARKLVRQSQFCERSSPAVKARAPTSSTTKLWSNHEKNNNCSSFPTTMYLTVHQTSTLHNTFYFNNTWTKIQLWSDPVNMQPDKTKCYPQTHYNVMACCLQDASSTCCRSPPLNSGTLSLHIERNCRIRRGDAGYCNVTLATTRQQACLDVLRPIFDVGKARRDGSLKFV